MIKGIWHTSFTVDDIEETIDFYKDVLGLDLVHRQSQNNEYTRKLVGYEDANLKVAMFKIPGTSPEPSGHVLEFVEYIQPEGEYVPQGTAHTRSAHVAFVVDGIHTLEKKLRQHGINFKSEVVSIVEGINQGGHTVYFLDPNGITLELVQPPAKL